MLQWLSSARLSSARSAKTSGSHGIPKVQKTVIRKQQSKSQPEPTECAGKGVVKALGAVQSTSEAALRASSSRKSHDSQQLVRSQACRQRVVATPISEVTEVGKFEHPPKVERSLARSAKTSGSHDVSKVQKHVNRKQQSKSQPEPRERAGKEVAKSIDAVRSTNEATLRARSSRQIRETQQLVRSQACSPHVIATPISEIAEVHKFEYPPTVERSFTDLVKLGLKSRARESGSWQSPVKQSFSTLVQIGHVRSYEGQKTKRIRAALANP